MNRRYYKQRPRHCLCGTCPTCKKAEAYRIAAINFFYDRRDDDQENRNGTHKDKARSASH